MVLEIQCNDILVSKVKGFSGNLERGREIQNQHLRTDDSELT
jgi:uncharacterized Zn ribbon protein